MLRYVVRRLLLLVPILLGVSILIFFWIRALPGNPASALLGERATPALVKQYKQRYGLDKPLPVQYWDYLKTTLKGERVEERACGMRNEKRLGRVDVDEPYFRRLDGAEPARGGLLKPLHTV